jgi:uncharacterized protein YbjT (DUF2867 family)
MNSIEPQANTHHPVVLVTGASGYVGGRLVRMLESRGVSVRCLARRPQHLTSRFGGSTEVVHGDVLDVRSLDRPLDGIDVAYYLVHSMGSTGDFDLKDRIGARNFATAARAAGVRRVVYLGGLGSDPKLSPHLRSRQEVGRILRDVGPPTIELRASIVIGSGSLSFEMVRALVEKLPVMVTPKWVRSLAQPIAIEDLLAYLIAARDIPETGSCVYEIGGANAVSYGEIMKEYARQRGLRRIMLPVPVLSPGLSSRWLGLVTPLYARVGRKLLDSVRHDTVVLSDRAWRAFGVRPRGIKEAIARALLNEDREFAETMWSDALSSTGDDPGWGGTQWGSRIVDSRSQWIDCSPSDAFTPIRRLGGDTGWYYGDWLWRLRGFLDLLVGGVGVRRGRRDPDRLVPGDAVDFWRVEAVDPDRLLRLGAEMKLPGRAWLQFEVSEEAAGVRIHQTAVFHPAGLLGLTYWYTLYPIHALIFRGMLRGLARAAAQQATSPSSAESWRPSASPQRAVR